MCEVSPARHHFTSPHPNSVLDARYLYGQSVSCSNWYCGLLHRLPNQNSRLKIPYPLCTMPNIILTSLQCPGRLLVCLRHATGLQPREMPQRYDVLSRYASGSVACMQSSHPTALFALVEYQRASVPSPYQPTAFGRDQKGIKFRSAELTEVPSTLRVTS